MDDYGYGYASGWVCFWGWEVRMDVKGRKDVLIGIGI